MAYKNIAVAGAAGNLGGTVLAELIASGKFNITVLTREGSSSTFPSSVAVKSVDYNSIESLTSALQGIEAVVSMIGGPGMGVQDNLVDAAVAAGVQRFIPSEFGSDRLNAKVATLPVFASKIKTQKHLESLAAQGKITYTFDMTGGFLDWGIDVGFLINVKQKKVNIADGGNSIFSVTTLASIGKSVVGILTHPEETKNRGVYVAEKQFSQQDFLKLAKSVVGDDGWEINEIDSDKALQTSFDRHAKGETGRDVNSGFMVKAIYDESYGPNFEKLDNELFGIKTLSDDEIIAIIKKVAGK